MNYQLNFDWPDFLRQYWQKKPVLIRQAMANFIDPIDANELAGLAMEKEIDSRLVSQQQGQWRVSHGPFNDYQGLGEQNWSLLVQAVNHWHQGAAQIMQPFRALSDWRIDDLMVSYSVKGGGVGPHLDQYDVFIIQGKGRRRWRVGENKTLIQHSPHPSLLQVDDFEAIIDEIMLPGDILYIPPGFPHEGTSLQESLNYSVGFRAPCGRELISDFADYLLANELGSERYQDPDLPWRDLPARIVNSELQSLQKLMLSTLQQPQQFREWFGQFISQSRHELNLIIPEFSCSPQDLIDQLKQGAVLTRLQGVRMLVVDNRLFVNGESFAGLTEPHMQILTQHQMLCLTDIEHCLSSEIFISQLTAMLNSGYWYFASAEQDHT